jgi:hypothetical protein
MSNSQSLTTIELAQLAHVAGGAGAPAAQTSQAELRQLAQQYCPATYQRFESARTITRPMAERCLDEAGLGMFRSRLDQYFPPRK